MLPSIIKCAVVSSELSETLAEEERVKQHKAARTRERAALNAASPDGWQFPIL